MKKFKILLVLFASIFIFNIKVQAGANLSVSTSNVTVGKEFTVYVNMSKAAAWNIHVTATGPVSGCSIHQADATADALDTSKKFSATCKATGTGEIKITLSGDVTSATDGNAVNISGTKTVTVTQASSNNNNNNNNKPNTNNNLSKNNNLKSLTVDGYELVKVDNKNYTLSVSNDITSINIKAEAEDSKAKVTGTGSHKLNVGENNIEVVITSESGAKNVIKIKVTRKDGYYLEDLESLLKDTGAKDISVNINSDSKISSEQLSKIKASGKTVKLNYFDENKKLLYSWILNGSSIQDAKEFSTSISYKTTNYKEIGKLSNYADGLYINFKHSGKLPAGTKIKVYVGDKFENGNLVNVYHYVKSEKKLEFIKDGLSVKDGYVEFSIEHCSEYFVTMSTIGATEIKGSGSFNIFMVISLIELIIIIILVLLYIKKMNKPDKEEIAFIKEEPVINTSNVYSSTLSNNTQNNNSDNSYYNNLNDTNNSNDNTIDNNRFY